MQRILITGAAGQIGRIARRLRGSYPLVRLADVAPRAAAAAGEEVLAAEILARGEKENEIAAQFHGGFYTPMEFAGDPEVIE